MAIWPDSQAVTTQLGINLQAKLVTGEQLILTKAVAGSGFVSPSALTAQTAVKDPKQVLSMGTPVYLGDGKAEITVQLNNATLDVGYTNWQIGIYAQDPDLGEILYMLAQASEPDPIPSKTQQSSVIIDHKYTIIYGSASEVIVTVDPAGLVTEGEFLAHLENTNPSIRHASEEQQSMWNAAYQSAEAAIIYAHTAQGRADDAFSLARIADNNAQQALSLIDGINTRVGKLEGDMTTVQDEVVYILFELAILGIIDTSGMKNVVSETFTAITDVNLISGQFSNGYFFI